MVGRTKKKKYSTFRESQRGREKETLRTCAAAVTVVSGGSLRPASGYDDDEILVQVKCVKQEGTFKHMITKQ